MLKNQSGLKKGVLKLEEYNEDYPKLFEIEKQRLSQKLEKIEFKNFEIEHVGSTAIKGIISKPIIDIILVVDNLKYFKENIIKKIADENYTIKEDNFIKGELLIRREENQVVMCFIHVVEKNSLNHTNYILFRNYMNKYEEKAKEYETLKLNIYKTCNGDRKVYVDSKHDFINKIINEAREDVGLK